MAESTRSRSSKTRKADKRVLKVFLDDNRTAPPGWVHTLTTEETIKLLQRGVVDSLSLDYDLDETDPVYDGGAVMLFVYKMAIEGLWDKIPNNIQIHSASRAGVAYMGWMLSALNREKFRRMRGERTLEESKQALLFDLQELRPVGHSYL